MEKGEKMGGKKMGENKRNGRNRDKMEQTYTLKIQGRPKK